MAADHGVAARGVSAYPQAVTRQMLVNFGQGGAAINVLARQFGVDLLLVDLGTVSVEPAIECRPDLKMLSARLGPGTQDFSVEPAMTVEVARKAIETGIKIGQELADAGIDVVGLGEMGIGNTTSAAAITSVLTGAPCRDAVGCGTGITEAQRQSKIALVEAAIRDRAPQSNDAIDVLAKIGGFEIGGLAGLVLGAASRGVAVVADGFIGSAALLIAIRICPTVAGYAWVAHQSTEPGHRALVAAIGSEPVLDLGMRLGEGTGAVLAMAMFDAAIQLYLDMATFEKAGVSKALDAA